MTRRAIGHLLLAAPAILAVLVAIAPAAAQDPATARRAREMDRMLDQLLPPPITRGDVDRLLLAAAEELRVEAIDERVPGEVREAALAEVGGELEATVDLRAEIAALLAEDIAAGTPGPSAATARAIMRWLDRRDAVETSMFALLADRCDAVSARVVARAIALRAAEFWSSGSPLTPLATTDLEGLVRRELARKGLDADGDCEAILLEHRRLRREVFREIKEGWLSVPTEARRVSLGFQSWLQRRAEQAIAAGEEPDLDPSRVMGLAMSAQLAPLLAAARQTSALTQSTVESLLPCLDAVVGWRVLAALADAERGRYDFGSKGDGRPAGVVPAIDAWLAQGDDADERRDRFEAWRPSDLGGLRAWLASVVEEDARLSREVSRAVGRDPIDFDAIEGVVVGMNDPNQRSRQLALERASAVTALLAPPTPPTSPSPRPPDATDASATDAPATGEDAAPR